MREAGDVRCGTGSLHMERAGRHSVAERRAPRQDKHCFPLAKEADMAATDSIPEVVPRKSSFPETTFREKMVHYYRRCRTAQMDRLRATWEFAVWFNAFAESNALDFRSVVEDLRRNHGLGWRYKTVLIYRTLARHEWDDVAAQGSVRRALEWARDHRRSDSERAEIREKRRMARNREREWEAERFAWAAERTRIRDERDDALSEVEKLKRELALLRNEVAKLRAKLERDQSTTTEYARPAPLDGAGLASEENALSVNEGKTLSSRDWR